MLILILPVTTIAVALAGFYVWHRQLVRSDVPSLLRFQPDLRDIPRLHSFAIEAGAVPGTAIASRWAHRKTPRR